MIIQILIKKGLNSDRTSIIPTLGEPIYTTDTNELYIGDGVTPGGISVNSNASGGWSRNSTDENIYPSSVTDSVVIGSSTKPSSSVALEVNSTTKGFLYPRMTEVQRDAIATPLGGLMIFNTTTNKLNLYNGVQWKEIQDI